MLKRLSSPGFGLREGRPSVGYGLVSEILDRETEEQILSDGGQFERSPMYHALALEDVLDLINICRAYLDSLTPLGTSLLTLWEESSTRMRAWLHAMSHPDGDLAFFNDTALGIAPHRDELEYYSRRLDLPQRPSLVRCTWLVESGYARLEQPNAVLICDMAPIGPDYLPGHAHADTLSFEFSLFGTRTFVNSGTSVYGVCAERLYQRGTAAHSTVVVAGTNSSDVWSSFRVGARARPRGARVESQGATLMAECAHDGYRSLKGRPIHHRRWEFAPERLCLTDALSAANHPAEAMFHLHPAVQAVPESTEAGRLILCNGHIIRWRSEGGPVQFRNSLWHPEFGVSLPSKCLVLPLVNGQSRLELLWDR